MLFADSGLSGGEASDGDTEGAAGDVVETQSVAEFHGCGVATVLAADTDVQMLVVSAAEGDSHVHELANTGLIQSCEGIVLEDLGVVVSGQELAGVVTGEAVGHLSQVVGTEAEEVSVLCDFVSGQASSGDLDHGADFVLDVSAGSSDLFVGGSDNDVLDVLQFLDFAGQGDHDLGNQVPLGMTALDSQS